MPSQHLINVFPVTVSESLISEHRSPYFIYTKRKMLCLSRNTTIRNLHYSSSTVINHYPSLETIHYLKPTSTITRHHPRSLDFIHITQLRSKSPRFPLPVDRKRRPVGQSVHRLPVLLRMYGTLVDSLFFTRL